MSERLRNILVGLTAILGVMSFTVILTLFGYVAPWMQRGYNVRIDLNHASDLSTGSQVQLSGIPIGQVRSVRLGDPPDRGVVVIAAILPEVRIPRGIKVSVEAPIIGGSPTLAFEVDRFQEAGAQTLPTDGTARIQGEVPSLASRFAEEFRAAMAEPFAQFERLSLQWTAVAEHLSEMIEPRTIEQVDGGQATANFATVLARLDLRLRELKKSVAGVNQWLYDEALRADVRSAAANASEAAKKLSAGADEIGELTREAKVQLRSLVKRVFALADDMSLAINTAQQALAAANTTDGSVGRLLNDPTFYETVNESFDRLRQMLEEAQLLLEKWKQEGVPIRF